MPTKLGQNFLNNKTVVKKIVDSANLTADDFVLEVGPGKGILTEELSKKCKKVIAVEIDRDLIISLRDKFKDTEVVEIIESDILKTDFKKLNTKYNISDTKYKIIANLPYYITSSIIRMFLEAELPPSEMILMVQKEVAERIISKPGNHSILSLSVQYYADPELLFYLDKSNFDPIPEVDSAVIRIKPKLKHIAQEESKRFFRVVRAGFCAKRKMLVNNLASSFHLEKKEVEKILKVTGISLTVRAQELSVEDWKNLAKYFI